MNLFPGIGVSKDLLKITGIDGKPKEIYKNVWQFSAQGKFLYVSEQRTKNVMQRHMKVSIDGGKTFEEVQLPSITPDRVRWKLFFKVQNNFSE